MPIVVVGPSGVGKSTLIDRLVIEYPDEYCYNVSHTTRAPRKGEEDGVDYHFVKVSKMIDMIKVGEFIEYTVYSKDLYGTSFQSIKDSSSSSSSEEHGRTTILIIDIKGAKNLQAINYEAIYIFIDTPLMSTLRQRLELRGDESPSNIESRLETAAEEIRHSHKLEWNLRITNDDLETCYRKLVTYLQRTQ